ncbi:MAG: hypothetical protein U9Q37_10505 [Euryarchaeota archaeon]|nr:hypothetical protein [Euryarchaeota archaeon]
MNINKTICVIMVVMVAGITVGCITPEDSGSDRCVDDTPTPEQYQVPDTVSTPTPEPTTVPTTKAISAIPDDYYNVTFDQYFVNHKIYNYLDGYTWNKPLVRGAGWGLPEVAELEHDLTERGCNVTIRYASVATTIDHEDFKNRVKTDGYARSACLPEMDQYETWLMIEFEGEMVAYDVYGSYWVFKPDHKSKNHYTSDGRWHSWYYYQEGTTEIYDGDTWTVYDFKDFKDIYEIEEWFLSGDARTWEIENCKNGVWCSYYTSDDYDPVDDFLINFGWWMTENEYHETETRINEATNWLVLIE